DAKHGATLGAFGNLKLLFSVQSRHLQFRTESGLRDAQGDGAVQVRAAAFEEEVLLDFEHDVQIACWPAVRPGLTFAGHAQPRSGIHTRGNAQLNGLFTLQATLSAALLAALLHRLSCALARWARARDGKESLLIGHLTSSGTGLAGLSAGALFRAGAVAGLAVFLPRQLDLGGYACGRIFERERHVIAQIGPAPCATASASSTASKQILEAKEVSE